MNNPRNRLRTAAACAAVIATAAALGADDPLVETPVKAIDRAQNRITVEWVGDIATDALLVLGTESEPLGVGKIVDIRDSVATFEFRDLAGLAEPTAVRGWIVPADFVATVYDRWPPGAELLAEIDSVGPGGQTVWIRAGRNQGIQPGDCWWLLIAGQPAARFDVRFAGATVCYAAAIPLVADLRLRPGERVALWPSPGERRVGAAATAVSYVDHSGTSVTVWLAAPQAVSCSRESQVEYVRDGRYLGHGSVERRDSRFWHASFRAAPCPELGPTSGPATLPATPTSAPAGTQPASQAVLPRVGDVARVRTQPEIDRRTFVARVFEVTPGGALINAGEADGLVVGQQGTLYRAGVPAGRVEVNRVQPAYAVIEPLRRPDAVAIELVACDQVRFGPGPPVSKLVGSIVTVVDGMLFKARLASEGTVPSVGLLSVEASGRVTGAALLIVAQESSGWGIVLPCSLTVPLTPGMRLVQDPCEDPAADPC